MSSINDDIVRIDDNDNDRPSIASCIRTHSGAYVDVLDPQERDIFTVDIAHGLAHTNRFNGHTQAAYSVAEHSLNVGAQLWRTYRDRKLTLCGLLHDASEAYIGDVVRPLKRLMPDYKDIETRLMEVIGRCYGLTLAELEDPRVKQVDNEILAWEMAMIRDNRVRVAPDPMTVRAELHRLIDFQSKRLRTDGDAG